MNHDNDKLEIMFDRHQEALEQRLALAERQIQIAREIIEAYVEEHGYYNDARNWLASNPGNEDGKNV